MVISRIGKLCVWGCLAAFIIPHAVWAENLLPTEPVAGVTVIVAPLTLEHAQELALAGNPGLARINARARALAEMPSQVGALADPTLSLNALNLPTDSYSRTQEPMTQMEVGLGFTLPFPGKLGLREQAAELEAKSAEYDVDELRLALIRNVRSTWWNLFYLKRALEIVQHNKEFLREFVKIAEIKYKTGQGMQSDVLLAQVELSKLLDSEISLKASQHGQAAALNALLGIPAANPVTLPVQVDETLPYVADVDSLRKQALEERPMLSSQRALLEATHVRKQLAEKDFYPDFNFEAAYGFRNGRNPDGSPWVNMVSFKLSMNLPIFAGEKRRHALSQSQVDVLREQYGLQDINVQVDTEIEQALADYQASREQTILYKSGIIPQASQTVASMLAAYQVNKVDFLNLIGAQVTLSDYETQYWKVLSSAWQALARLEAAIGKPVTKSAQQDTAGISGKEMNK